MPAVCPFNILCLKRCGLAGYLVIAALLSGCGTTKQTISAYEAESFTRQSPFQHELALPPEDACQLGQRALLSQGYLIETIAMQNLRATKFFQPENDRQMRLAITLVCLPVGGGTTIFASAIQTRYELKFSSSNTGLSVAGIGSISLPWGAESKEAMIKVGEETVVAPDFYGRLFDLIRQLAG